MAFYLNEVKMSKNNQLMVVFHGGGKYVWYPSKEDILVLITAFLNKEDNYEIPKN